MLLLEETLVLSVIHPTTVIALSARRVESAIVLLARALSLGLRVCLRELTPIIAKLNSPKLQWCSCVVAG